MNGKAVLVTTAHRGVFFGTLAEDQDWQNKEKLVLLKCRNIIYWSGKKGFLGVAVDGPESGSRIGSTAEKVLLNNITSVTECTDKAAAALGDW